MTTPFFAGAARLPLSLPAGGSSALRDADPALFFLLDYLSWSVRTYVGARCLDEANRVGLTWTDAVADAVAFDPRAHPLDEAFDYPLLAVYRVQSDFAQLSSIRRTDVSRVEVAYVLPPLSPAQRAALSPLLHAAKALIAHRLDQGRDAAYTPPGGVAGQSLLDPSSGGLSALRVVDARFVGYLQDDDDDAPRETPVFPSVVLTVSVTEDTQLDEQDLPAFDAQARIALRGDADEDDLELIEIAIDSTP